MAKAFTQKSVEQFKPADKRREIPDALLTGLYLIVQPAVTGGAKSWAVRYRHAGKPRKLTIGPFPAFDLLTARNDAKEALQLVAKGIDPAAEKRTAKQEAASGRDLVETIVGQFLERHAKGKKSHDEIKRMLDHDVLPAWRGRRIQDITRRDVIELMDGLVDRGVGPMTNRVFSVVRKLFNWCVGRDIIVASPFVGLRPPVAEISRDRVLTDDEIKAFWQGTETLGYPFGPLFRLMLLTGQREGEVAGMTTAELHGDLWSLPKERTKNGRPHDVPLSDEAKAIVHALPRMVGTKLLFTTTGKTSVSGWSRAKRTLDNKMQPEEPWVLHDLRRTLATGMQRLGIPPHITEAVLNHKSGTIKGVAAVYARHDYADEKRSALAAWSRYVMALVEGRDDNVVQLAAVRGA